MPRYASILVFLAAPAFSQNTASIKGTVNDDSGKPIANAIAVATLQSVASHATSSAVTGANGSFTLTNLAPGKYSICIHAPGEPQLNPCQWSQDTQVTVAAGQAVANQTITSVKGSLLQVRINDLGKVLTPADDLMIGIYLPNGLFQPLRLAASDPTGRTYDTAVPLATAARLAVISTHLQIADDKGASLAPTAIAKANFAPPAATSTTLTLPAQSAANGPPIKFTITGRK
jgi:hypothetical protein